MINELKETRAEKVDAAKELQSLADTEDRELTEEESTKLDAFLDEAEDLRAQIDSAEEKLARRQRLSDVSDSLKETSKAADVQVVSDPITRLRSRSYLPDYLKHIDPVKGFESNAHAYACGQWLRAKSGSQEARKWVETYGPQYGATMNTGINTQGAALVPSPLSSAIINLRNRYGVFRQNARVWPMTSDTLDVPRRTAGATVYYTGDDQAITASTPTSDVVGLVAKKPSILVKVSSELMEDAVIEVAGHVADEIGYAFAKAEDDAGFKGDGTSTYGGIVGIRGILEANLSYIGSVDAEANDDQFSELTIVPFYQALGYMPDYALDGAKWYISPFGWANAMLRLAIAGGGNAVPDFAGGMGPQFLGYPVVFTNSLRANDTAADDEVLVVFANLQLGAAFGSRRNVTVTASSDRYFESDVTAFRGTQRYDINVEYGCGDATNAGPIVGIVSYT